MVIVYISVYGKEKCKQMSVWQQYKKDQSFHMNYLQGLHDHCAVVHPPGSIL